jgi:NAD(P)-dependent dehydrogenase (short-subunit alcohol dehydrogenase family)
LERKKRNMNQIDLQGRHAVVTGGAQGIGRGIAERILISGATVSLWDCNVGELIATANKLKVYGEVQALEVDVTNPSSVANATAAVEEKRGRIDILIANAGISGPNVKSWEYPVESWQQVIDVNLTGVFLCCRAITPGMLKRNYGRIVNTASIAGKEGNPNASAYSAAKAGVIALTKSMGKELASMNVAVNCITPAAARTGIFEQMTQEHIDYMLSKIPRARFVEINEIASMVAWLVSEENSFTTGAVFDLSGGRATY